MKLRISDNLSLPLDFITSTQAILAKKRVGKTYTAQVLAEELLAAGQQVVVIDLTSAWWGLRSSADGKSAGYPITIFGGRHGDLPLEATAGEVLANAIVADKFSAVLDVRLLKKGQRLRFIADFLETLYDKNTEAMHLFCDEADAYCPQQTFSPEQARALGATDELVRRGGIGGIGVTLISQRAQTLNKNVLSQVDQLTVLRMNHPKDIGAIKDWIVEHVDADKAKEMVTSLPSLPKGEAWVWAPEHDIFKRISVRAKRTYDSGRTPKVGEQIKAPKVLAKIDLDRLGANIKETVERAKENDPKALKAKIAELVKERDQLSRAVNALPTKPTKSIETKIVERSVLKDGQLARAEKILESTDRVLSAATARVEKTIEDVRGTFGGALARAEQSMDELRGAIKLASAPMRSPVPTPSSIKQLDKNTKAPKPTSAPKTNGMHVADDANGHDLKPAHLRLLSAIAWWEAIGVTTPDLGGVAFVAKTSTKSSAFDNNRSRLRAAGYINYPSTGHVELTEAGRAIAPPPTLPPTNEALHDAILGKVTPAHGRMLRALIEAYPNEMSLEEFAKLAATSVTSSAFDNNRSWLRARGLAEYPRTGFVRATALLFPEAS